MSTTDQAQDPSLFPEDHWRRTGGKHDGIWLGNEAPHEFPTRKAS